ncbi:PEP-CTERM sorting domain-containing protein [Roseococcus sp. DSY-14]|uniref:PEP-CTERM sorting domain-containing protein n=1 Tax=Roseococcus sp. DSY-14 TaxID=3369650 RepID=UPI00387AD1AC
MSVFRSLPGLSLGVALGLAAALPAAAAVTDATAFVSGQGTQVVGGVTWTPTGGVFQQKFGFLPLGVGVSGGRTGDEIDIGEAITGTPLGGPVRVTSLTLGVLFDGPEFDDVNEVAQVTVNGTLSFLLTAIGATTATWTGLGTVTNISPATANGGGAGWRIDNPFGQLAITSISLTALPGACAGDALLGGCSNPSDFTLVQMVTAPAAVPAPGALALFGAALLGLGLARRRA